MEENTKDIELERVKIILDKYYNGNVSAMSRGINLQASTINNYILGRRGVSLDLINAILTDKRISAEWLLRGEGSMERGIINQIVGRLGSCGDGDVFQSVGEDADLRARCAKLEQEKERLLKIIESLTTK